MAKVEDLEIVDDEVREGYYKDENGEWQPERRVNPDRRMGVMPKPHHRAMRKRIRRKVDRETLQYVSDEDAHLDH